MNYQNSGEISLSRGYRNLQLAFPEQKNNSQKGVNETLVEYFEDKGTPD